MILLDTNVFSEAISLDGDPHVRTWLRRVPAEALVLASVVLAELLYGIAAMPAGKRRAGLSLAVDRLVRARFAGRILPFDEAAARAYASLVADARSAGRAISMPDGQIAAIATVNGCTVATRDTAPFAAAGVPTLDPWSEP